MKEKFCGKCGSQLQNGVCSRCGWSQPAAPTENVSQEAPNTNVKNRKRLSLKKINPLCWVVLVLVVVLVLLILQAAKVINLPFLSTDAFMKFDDNSLDGAQSAEATTTQTEPENNTGIETMPTLEQMDVRDYYSTNGTIVSESTASSGSQSLSEKAVIAEMQRRGFTDIANITYEYKIDGTYVGSKTASAESDDLHPTYSAAFTDNSGNAWSIQVVEGQFMAIPYSLLAQAGTSREIIVAAEDYTTCYDAAGDTFYRVTPKAEYVRMCKINEVNAEALNGISYWELGVYDG